MPLRILSRSARSQAGFGLIQVLGVGGVILLAVMASMSVHQNRARDQKIFASRSAKTSLAGAVRLQLSLRASCAASMVVPPSNLSGTSEIAVRLGNAAGADVVQAGADLSRYNTRVQSLQIRSPVPFGTTASGRTVYTADVFLKTASSNLGGGQRVTFKEVFVSKITLEASGSTLTACNTTDSTANPAQQIRDLCNMIASPEGTPGVIDGNGRCVVQDMTPATRCSSYGGTWNGSRCSFFKVTAWGLGFNGYETSPGNWYGKPCANGGVATGGACLSGSGPPANLKGMFSVNRYYCGWDSDPNYAQTSYVMTGKCVE